jgi:hypothetical protein
MKTIDKIVPKMDKVEVFEMPNVFVVGVAKRNHQLQNGAGSLWGELFNNGTLKKLSELPRIIPNHLVGWTGDCCEDGSNPNRDFTYMVGAITPYDTPIPEGFDFRVLRFTLVGKGLLGQDMGEAIAELVKMGYEPNYGDNNGWNAELYLDGEPNEDKWSWLIPVKKIKGE